MLYVVLGVLFLVACVLFWRSTAHFDVGDQARSDPTSMHVTESQLAQVRQEGGRPYAGPDSGKPRRRPPH